VNFIGHFHLVQLLLPSLQRQQGALRIVAVTCKGELDPGADTDHAPACAAAAAVHSTN
jgi:NAD(P)-dependent dehydrogenase (short-subunit alcohol dehydrogenase family)